MSSKELLGKVALVTGGGRGIGRGITLALLAAGAHVVVAQRTQPAPFTSAGRGNQQVPKWIAADLSDPAALPGLVESVVAEHERLDVLVNCAGIMFERDPSDLTVAEWDRMLALNLRTPMFLTQAALPYLADGASIINIGSIEGIGANPGHAAYAASKAGLHGLTKALAVDLGPRGIRCNAIAPGWIDSDLSKTYLESMSAPQEAYADLLRAHPVGRLGTVEDIGHAAVFLAGDRSSFMTGEILVIDGGRTAKLPTPTISSA